MSYLVIDAEGWHGDTIRVWASHETLAAARKDVSGRVACSSHRGKGQAMTRRPSHEEIVALVAASGIDDATGTLYEVCRQAIRDGDGTPDAVRRIWREATAEWAAERGAVGRGDP